MSKYLWPSISVLSLIGIVVLLFVIVQQPKSGFFYNEKVFVAFKGKIELENKLKIEQTRNKANLDSLAAMIAAGRNDLKGVYEHTAELASSREQQLTQQYTSDIWKFINEKVSEYGKENNYEFIFGAMGDGGLMFASPEKDITDQIIIYINKEYSGSGSAQ